VKKYILHTYEDGTQCSETSACKIQRPGHYPEESIQHTEHDESLKSRNTLLSALSFRHPLRCDRGLRFSAMLRGRMLVHFGTKVKRSNNLALQDGTGVVSRNVCKPTTSLRCAALQKSKPSAVFDVFVTPFFARNITLNVHLCVLCARALAFYVYICLYVLIYTGCLRRNGQNFGRVFLMLKYTI